MGEFPPGFRSPAVEGQTKGVSKGHEGPLGGIRLGRLGGKLMCLGGIEIIQPSVWRARELLDFVMDALGPTKVGGPERLQCADLALPLPGAGEVQIERRAIDVNFIDENFQFDLYSEPNPQRLISDTDAEGVIREISSARRD